MWLAAASQARSGCEFEGGGIGARFGLLSSSPPVGWLRGSLFLTMSFDLSRTLFGVLTNMKLEAGLPNLTKGRNTTKILKYVADGITVISLSWVFIHFKMNVLLSGKKILVGQELQKIKQKAAGRV